MEYILSFYPNESETAAAAVRAESDDNSKLEELCKRAAGYLEQLGDIAEKVRQYGDSALGKIVCEYDGDNKEKELYLNEEDAIASVLYSCLIPDFSENIEGLNVTIDYKGDIYENISEIRALKSELGYCGTSFAAKKNGGASASYYLLTKTNLGGLEFKEHTAVQSSSAGIIETNSKREYAGSRLFYSDKFVTDYDEEGFEFTTKYENALVSAAHLFFESNGENFTFSVLINGELRNKISKTDNAVSFYHTTFGSSDPDERDIVFKKVNELYLNGEFLFKDKSRAFNSSIAMPSIPEGSDMNISVFSEFYDECVNALHKAFENSEKYLTTTDQWEPPEQELTWLGKLGSDKMPGRRVTIKRADNGKRRFSFEDAMILAEASAPCGKTDFEETFSVSFPDLTVFGIEFTKVSGAIALYPSGNRPDIKIDIKITDALSEKIIDLSFEELKNNPDFDSADIPQKLSFDKAWISVKEQFGIFRKIKNAVLKFVNEKYRILLDEDMGKQRDEIAELLYDEGMIRDENVISAVIKLKKEYDRTGHIPNIALIGQAGIGKTNLAKKLGKIFDKEVLLLTPSVLKGSSSEQTKYKTAQKLAEAEKNNKILYLDEAYQLNNDLGGEALTLLLSLMTGEQTKIGVGLDKDSEIIEIDCGVPIWISGYESEIRSIINQNRNLYRRLEQVVIKTPAASVLLRLFNDGLEKLAKGVDTTSRKAAMLIKHFEDNGNESVEKYFVWCTQPQVSKYFANYSGVNRFLKNCIDQTDFNIDLGSQIEELIFFSKRDIKRQMSAVGTGDKTERSDSGDAVNVITDIDACFSDVVGCEEQKEYLKSIIEMLINKSVYNDLKITVPKGALLEGPHGVGKTLIARAMAGELQQRFRESAFDKRFGFISFSVSELEKKPGYIAAVFDAAEKYDACVLFIDDADIIARERSHNPFCGSYLEFLKQMDDIEDRSNIFILAATNAPEKLDSAFKRSGRINKTLTLSLPGIDDRKNIAVRAINKRIKTLVDLEYKGVDSIAKEIANRTSDYTAGDIENIINTAFIRYHQYEQYVVKRNDSRGLIDSGSFIHYPLLENRFGSDNALDILRLCIFEEIERESVGTPRNIVSKGEFEINKNSGLASTAIHEVGHAVVNLIVGANLFDVITVIPRGSSSGYVEHFNVDSWTKSDYVKKICSAMGGRIAEEIFYGKENISTGAVCDMQQATGNARKMVEKYGFSDEFGFMAVVEPNGNNIDGDCHYTCSEAFREKADTAVNELLKKLYRKTYKLLADKKELIEKLAEKVYYEEIITGTRFKELYNKLLRGEELPDESEQTDGSGLYEEE